MNNPVPRHEKDHAASGTVEQESTTFPGDSWSSLPTNRDQFGPALEPLLRKACGNRLSAITWFRADWQRGGAATAYATYEEEQDSHQVVVKVPVRPAERRWLQHLQSFPQVAPKLYAHGQALGGYDLAWVVMQRISHGPFGPEWGPAAFDLVIEAAGRFYAATSGVPLNAPPPARNWQQILDLARRNVQRHQLANEQRWKASLKKAQRQLKRWVALWSDRPIDQWCHGDLHLGNAMSHHPPPDGPAVLVDYADVHPGHWIEDAVYFEHLYWAHRSMLGQRKICSAIARQRKELNLPVNDDWPKFASVRRALLAMSTPARLEHVGIPSHVQAALKVLEQEVR